MRDDHRAQPRTEADPLPNLTELFPLSVVPRRMPPAESGRPVHISAPHRWAARGILGVRLRVVELGGRRMTTERWLVEFARDVAAARQRATEQPRARRRTARTEGELMNAGDGISPSSRSGRTPSAKNEDIAVDARDGTR